MSCTWNLMCVFVCESRYTQADWHSGCQDAHSETAVLIEPPEGTVTRVCNEVLWDGMTVFYRHWKRNVRSVYVLQSRSGGPGLVRILRGAFCSRQRTPLLVSLYLLTIHAVLLLCLGGYLWASEREKERRGERGREKGGTLHFLFIERPDNKGRVLSLRERLLHDMYTDLQTGQMFLSFCIFCFKWRYF